MKNYSRKKAKKGKLAYRTPSVFKYNKNQKTIKIKAKNKMSP